MSKCQADQLAVAVRSPITAEKDKYGRGIEMIEEGPRLRFLVDGGEVGNGHVGSLAMRRT